MNNLTLLPKEMLMTENVQRVAIRLSMVAALLVAPLTLVSTATALRPVMQEPEPVVQDEASNATASDAEVETAEASDEATSDQKTQANAVQGAAIGSDPLSEPVSLDRSALSSPSDRKMENILKPEGNLPQPTVDLEISSVGIAEGASDAAPVTAVGIVDVPYNEYYWQYEKERLAKVHELRVRRAQFQSYSRLLRTERNLWLGYEPLRPNWPTPPQSASRYSHVNRIVVPIYTYLDASY